MAALNKNKSIMPRSVIHELGRQYSHTRWNLQNFAPARSGTSRNVELCTGLRPWIPDFQCIFHFKRHLCIIYRQFRVEIPINRLLPVISRVKKQN